MLSGWPGRRQGAKLESSGNFGGHEVKTIRV